MTLNYCRQCRNAEAGVKLLSFALYNAKRACLLLFLCLLKFQLLLHPLHVLPQALKQYFNFWSERKSWPSASSYPPRLKPSESSHAIIGEDEMPTYLVIKAADSTQNSQQCDAIGLSPPHTA